MLPADQERVWGPPSGPWGRRDFVQASRAFSPLLIPSLPATRKRCDAVTPSLQVPLGARDGYSPSRSPPGMHYLGSSRRDWTFMIVSHSHRFIFIKTRKVAGTSVDLFLSQFCGEEDIVTTLGPDEKLREGMGWGNYWVSGTRRGDRPGRGWGALSG